jgi:hypothetical protein
MLSCKTDYSPLSSFVNEDNSVFPDHLRIIPRRLFREANGQMSRATEQRRLRDDPRWPRPVKGGYRLSDAKAYLAAKLGDS